MNNYFVKKKFSFLYTIYIVHLIILFGVFNLQFIFPSYKILFFLIFLMISQLLNYKFPLLCKFFYKKMKLTNKLDKEINRFLNTKKSETINYIKYNEIKEKLEFLKEDINTIFSGSKIISFLRDNIDDITIKFTSKNIVFYYQKNSILLKSINRLHDRCTLADFIIKEGENPLNNYLYN